jgi:hypothetical protein
MADDLQEIAKAVEQAESVTVWRAAPNGRRQDLYIHFPRRRKVHEHKRGPFATGFLVTLGVLAAICLLAFFDGCVSGFVIGYQNAVVQREERAKTAEQREKQAEAQRERERISQAIARARRLHAGGE